MKPLDPRTKLTLGTLAIGAVLLARKPSSLIVAALLVAIVGPLAGLGRPLAGVFRRIWPMIALVLVIGVFFFNWQTGLLLALRLFALLTVSSMVFILVSPEETGDAMRKMGIPFEFAFVLTTAMRYVPLIGKKIRNIKDAQTARGFDFRPSLKNIRNYFALLMPLLVQSFLMSDQLALAMESRGFGRKQRSSRRSYRLALKDYGSLAGALILLGAFVWWEFI